MTSPLFEKHFLPGDRVRVTKEHPLNTGELGTIVEMERSESGLGIRLDGASHSSYNWPEGTLELVERK
jgi:hypothetical protein